MKSVAFGEPQNAHTNFGRFALLWKHRLYIQEAWQETVGLSSFFGNDFGELRCFDHRVCSQIFVPKMRPNGA
jgi:hypothetical protein